MGWLKRDDWGLPRASEKRGYGAAVAAMAGLFEACPALRGARLQERIGAGVAMAMAFGASPALHRSAATRNGCIGALAGEEFLRDFVGDGVDGFFADALGAECGKGDCGEVEVARWLRFDFR